MLWSNDFVTRILPTHGGVCLLFYSELRLIAHDEGAWIQFVVSDDGPGIDPQFHQKIFDIFQTLQPRDTVEGSGMGLAIVKKAIELVGGTITVDSAVGAGATFRFTWPKGIQRVEEIEVNEASKH